MSSKREFWFQHIEAWQKSQLTQSEYARQQSLSIKSFGYYRRRYSHEHEYEKVSLLPVSVETEVTEKPANTAPGITLTSPKGFRIELAAGFDQHALQQVLRILEAA